MLKTDERPAPPPTQQQRCNHPQAHFTVDWMSTPRSIAIMRQQDYNARPIFGHRNLMQGEKEMNKRDLHRDLLHSGKYRQQIVKAKKGKGAFSRHDKHKRHHLENGGVFLCAVLIS
jgi:domain of unknown function